MTYTSHNKICYACGQEKKRREMGYDIRTLKTYCKDKNECSNPEAIPNVELVELTTPDLRAALDAYYNQELLYAFNRVLGKTVSTRPVPAMAMHLMKTAQTNGLETISETLNFILERDFAKHEISEELDQATEHEKAVAIMETHREMEENAPVATPKMQEILDKVQIVIDEKEIEPKQEEDEDGTEEFTF